MFVFFFLEIFWKFFVICESETQLFTVERHIGRYSSVYNFNKITFPVYSVFLYGIKCDYNDYFMRTFQAHDVVFLSPCVKFQEA